MSIRGKAKKLRARNRKRALKLKAKMLKSGEGKKDAADFKKGLYNYDSFEDLSIAGISLEPVFSDHESDSTVYSSESDGSESMEGDAAATANESDSDSGKHMANSIEDISLEPVFSDYESDSMEDGSDSDGFLPESLEGAYDAASESDSNCDSDEGNYTDLPKDNKELRVQKVPEFADSFQDPEFAECLKSHADELEQGSVYSDFDEEITSSDQDKVEANADELKQGSVYSDFDEEITSSDQDKVEAHADELEQGSVCSDFDVEITSDQDKVEADSSNVKTLTTSIINSWCQMVLGEKSLSVVSNLLNAYRVACRYGFHNASSRRIKNSEAFCKIVNFILCEADNIFRTHLEISISDCETHTVLKLQNTQNWKDTKPLIRSYLSSTIKFLNQVTDSEIRAFVLTRLRASAIFFAEFPSLLQELIKVTVDFVASGEGKVPAAAFLIMKDAAPQLSSKCRECCLIKTYKTFIAKGKLGYTNSLHTKSRVDSLVKLYSLDVSRSYSNALVSVKQLAKISEQGLLTKKKEVKQKIFSWQYINCVDLWVKFVCANAGDDKDRQLMTSIVQIIQAVAKLFPKPQHLPLRVKCVQMLNELSSSFGRLIPVASLVLDCMEYMGTGKPDAESVKPFDISFALKVSKQWVNSRLFQEECVLSAIELLSAHFAQWSYLTSFPTLAGFPLRRLKKFHEKITIESLQSRLESLIKMVEKNVEFVNKYNSKINVDNEMTPFTQYYTDMINSGLARRSLPRSVVMKSKEKSEKKVLTDYRTPHEALAKQSGGIFNLIIGFILDNAVVMAGDPGRILKRGSVILGVGGSHHHLVDQLLVKLQEDLVGWCNDLEKYARTVLSHIRSLEITRDTHLFVFVGGCDTKSSSPQLWYVNKGGISPEYVKCTGVGETYAELVVKNEKLFDPSMEIKDAYALAREGFIKARVAHGSNGAQIIRCGCVLATRKADLPV